MGAIGMQCQVGDCLYAAEAPPAPEPTPEPPPPYRLPRINHPEEFALVTLGTLAAAFLAAVGYFVRHDRAHMHHLAGHGSATQLAPGSGSGSDDEQEMTSLTITAACAPACEPTQMRARHRRHAEAIQKRPNRCTQDALFGAEGCCWPVCGTRSSGSAEVSS